MFQKLSSAIRLQDQSSILGMRLRLRGGRRDQGDGRRPVFASRTERPRSF